VACKSQVKDDHLSDKEVFRSIFPELLDSIYVEVMYQRYPVPLRVDSSSGKHEYIKVEKDLSLKEEFRDEIKNHKGYQISFVIDDTIRDLMQHEIDDFAINHKLSADTTWAEYAIDLTRFKKEYRWDLISEAAYIPSEEIVPYHRIIGVLSFTRIIFNNEQDVGMLMCRIHCGLGCGSGYRIFIKQVNEKWIIDRVEFDYMV
jgi:hypothetical protein